MKNIFKILSFGFLFLLLAACRDDGMPNPVYEAGSYVHFAARESQTTAPTPGYRDHQIHVSTIAAVPSPVTVTLVPQGGTAVHGVDYEMLDNGTIQIAAGESTGAFTIRIYGENLDMMDPKTAIFGLTSSLPNAGFNQTHTVSMTLKCESDLAGTYAYSTVNMFTPESGGVTNPGPVTGNVVITEVSDGLYSLSDSSFGGYPFFYNAASTGVRLRDLCGKLSFEGGNQYGDTFTIQNVVVNGTNLTFRWVSSYGEYGTTTLTRATGWPPLN